tara:strand:+ start:5323 stop:5616 length:294 start_codon:yes stop_codon:yes gene_type:complete
MPRTNGSRNNSDYKYKVEKINDNNEVISTEYFVSQSQVQTHTGLKRSAVYFMIHHPEKRKNHCNYKIIKMEIPLPVYKMEKKIEDDKILFEYQKLIY